MPTPASGNQRRGFPRGAVKQYRDYLNAQNAAQLSREATMEPGSPGRVHARHKHVRFHQRVRLYGDYLYAQDREKFMVNLREWLRECGWRE